MIVFQKQLSDTMLAKSAIDVDRESAEKFARSGLHDFDSQEPGSRIVQPCRLALGKSSFECAISFLRPRTKNGVFRRLWISRLKAAAGGGDLLTISLSGGEPVVALSKPAAATPYSIPAAVEAFLHAPDPAYVGLQLVSALLSHVEAVMEGMEECGRLHPRGAKCSEIEYAAGLGLKIKRIGQGSITRLALLKLKTLGRVGVRQRSGVSYFFLEKTT